MNEEQQPQRTLLSQLLMQHPIVRAYELRNEGIDPKTISRAVAAGELIRISRGLYQRPEADIDTHQVLAEAAKKVPRGVVAMVSALAYHELTDQMPRKVWIAVSVKDWSPSASSYPPIRIVEFRDRYMQQGIEHHTISGISVPIYSIPKTLADVFRNRKLVDRSVAVEALRATLDQRKATPASIADAAMAGDAWNIMRPYLEALTSNG
ncbi:type IV toxin-antitoxin system AbiEi family antitoxin domain-containing protein [Sphingomonas sp. RS6]